MPNTITIQNQAESGNGWKFTVDVDGRKYQVQVNQADYQRISGGKIEPTELVKKSFEFLLEREPKESILSQFNITVISTYFPEYENEIKNRIG